MRNKHSTLAALAAVVCAVAPVLGSENSQEARAGESACQPQVGGGGRRALARRPDARPPGGPLIAKNESAALRGGGRM